MHIYERASLIVEARMLDSRAMDVVVVAIRGRALGDILLLSYQPSVLDIEPCLHSVAQHDLQMMCCPAEYARDGE